jgi:hypothetical protein
MERLWMTFDRDTVVPDGPPVRVMAITREQWLANSPA